MSSSDRKGGANVVQFGKALERKRLLTFADGVVTDFKRALEATAASKVVFRRPLILLTFDRITFEGTRDVSDMYVDDATKKAMRGFSFAKPLKASEVLQVVFHKESETRSLLVELLVNLRRETFEGKSAETGRAIQELLGILGTIFEARALQFPRR